MPPLPIRLPNGLEWATKRDAVAHFRKLFQALPEAPAIGGDSAMAELAALAQALSEALAGARQPRVLPGILHFMKVRLDGAPGKPSVLRAVRLDGTLAEFSFLRALDMVAHAAARAATAERQD